MIKPPPTHRKKKPRNNRDKAAEVIWDAQASGLAKPRDLADELDAAGVLADDLPAPTRTMFPGGRVWRIEGPVGDVRATSTGQVVAFGTWQEQPFRIVSTPEKMRTLARALEAAADHAETEVTDG